MFSQGRRMLAALQQGNISTSTPDVPVTKTLDKKSKEAPEKETQPDNSRETSVLGEKTNDESDSDDDSAFTPSEKNILNPAWPTVESPDDDYPSNLQENPSPCSILSSGRPSHNSSFGEDIHTSPMGLQNMLVSYGFTPEEENTTANYTSCAARKRLVFSSCNDREPNAEPAELMPLNDSTCHLSGQEKTFHELQTINLGETFPQESSVSLVQQQSTELKDMFYDDSEDVIIMSYDTPHDVQVEVRAVPEDTNAITEDQSVMEVEANVMTTPVQEEIAQRVKTPQKKRTRNAIPNNNSPSRKRIRNPKGTKIAKAKVAYNSGLAHTTSRGKERKARELKPGCPNTCRKKCQERISYERRCRLFKTYYSSASKEAQWLMLGKLVKKVPVSRRTVPGGSSPFRKSSYTYSLTDDDGNSISVCQSMFLATFDISITVVQNALRKNSPDKRGKQVHSRPTRVSPNLKEGVKNHIRSFPTIPSHYCREDSKRQYLQENLSVTKMYRMYLTERGKNTPNTASLRQYRDIFNYCFNLGFYQPKKDQCALCTKWKDLPEESKTEDSEIYQEYHEHVAAKEIARNLKQESKDFSRSKELNGDGKLKVICFDLQKVFFCPKSEIGDLFYKSKIACYNFTIYDCTLKKATCFVWDLTVAGRGAMEISSCVLKYIEQEVAKGVKEIHIYSDSCWGQNKNQFLFSMYYMACQKFQIKIVHRYLQKDTPRWSVTQFMLQ